MQEWLSRRQSEANHFWRPEPGGSLRGRADDLCGQCYVCRLVITRQAACLRGQNRQFNVVAVIRKLENNLEIMQAVLHAVADRFLAGAESKSKRGVVGPLSRLHVIRKRQRVLHKYSHNEVGQWFRIVLSTPSAARSQSFLCSEHVPWIIACEDFTPKESEKTIGCPP